MPVITLDPDHRYTVDGRPAPGVNQILTGLGLIDARWFTPEGRDRGKAVHACVHYYLENDLEWDTVDERIKGRVEAAIAFIDDTKFQPVLVEAPVACLTPLFAGTPDLVGIAFETDDTVVDWKSGALLDIHGLTTAGYDIAAGGKKRRRRMGVELHENGRYRKVDFEDRRDYLRFPAAADLFNRYLFTGDERAAA